MGREERWGGGGEGGGGEGRKGKRREGGREGSWGGRGMGEKGMKWGERKISSTAVEEQILAGPCAGPATGPLLNNFSSRNSIIMGNNNHSDLHVLSTFQPEISKCFANIN